MKERFKVLDIFRGIFASLVVFFHMSAFSNTAILNNKFIYNCDLFVDFFFVLSGFVIAYNYWWLQTAEQTVTFYKKRFFRLYPLHLIILLIFVAIEFSKYKASGYVHVNRMANDGNNIETFFTNIFLLNSVKFPGINDVSWNVTSWSISAEMIAYLVFGLLATAINRKNLSRYFYIFCLLITLASIIILRLITGSFTLMYSFDYGFLRGLIGFFTGTLCFFLYNKIKSLLEHKSNYIFTFSEIVILVAILVMVYYGFELKPYGFLYEILFLAAIIIFSFEKGWISNTIKKSNLLHNAGKYSYSIYMTHPLLLSLFNIVFIRLFKFPPSSYVYLFIINYILIYFVSAFTFKNIEMRFSLLNKPHQPRKNWWTW